jgi:predicted TIM-barrel fold metal-dependent hydrolase
MGRYAYPIADLSPEGLVTVMDRVGVDKTVVSHMQCMSTDVDWGNAEILRGMEACPGRILGYISVFPSTVQQVAESVRRWFALGFTGLKFHDSNQFPYDDTAYEPAYEFADRHRLPILLHTWGQEHEFRAARTVAARYANLTFLLGHSGSANIDRYIETANAAENIYLETCFSRAPRGTVETLVQRAGADKVVWGSDSYFYSMTQQVGKILGARISDDDKIKVMRTNAENILARIAH